MAERPAHFVGINVVGFAEFGYELVDRCAFPLFQEVQGVDIAALHHAGKDDLLVYDADGRLGAYLPIHGELNVNLATPEGYANLRRVILEVAEGAR